MNAPLRSDFNTIAQWIAPNSRILDLGCGDGSLLHHLQATRNTTGYGVEIAADNINACTARGIAAIQANIDTGLNIFETHAFDFVILSQTLQAMHNTEAVIQEILRIGKQAIVSFPNFGYWRVRTQLWLGGRMPVSDTLPYEWYNTPNIHLCTIKDFEAFCATQGIRILETCVTHAGKPIHSLANWRGSLAFFRIEKTPFHTSRTPQS